MTARRVTMLAVLAGVAAMQPATQAAPGGGVVRVEHRDPDTLPTRGPRNALVTVEVFFIPGILPTRGATFRNLERLQAAHPTRIRLVYRVLKRNAQIIVPIAALEAHAQGKFHELMDLLRDTPSSTGLTKDKLLELVRKIDMDPARLSAAISEGRYAEVFAENERRLERFRAGTPTSALFNSKPTTGSFSAMTDEGFEREYLDAYERAQELLDRGVRPAALPRAFDDKALRGKQPLVYGIDDDEEGEPGEHRLASPPLVLKGLPSYGRPDTSATVPIVVLCRPNDPSCAQLMRTTRRVQEIYSDDVRLYWGPWFDVTARDDAADLSLLADAALCAEQLGTTDDFSASPGWRWVQKHVDLSSRPQNRRVAAEKLIDQIARDLGVDRRQMSACRARIASRSLDWIGEARRSGVTASPALVIGGRIYERLGDQTIIQQLIEAELAPGVLGEVAPDWRTR